MSTAVWDEGPVLATLCAQTCDRCGQRRGRCVELGMLARDPIRGTQVHVSRLLCLVQCWPELVGAIHDAARRSR